MNTPKTPRQKPPRWADMADGMKDEILKQLTAGGFGSEIQARRVFAEEGFDAWATYFHDRDSNQTRELDVFASLKPRDGCNFYHQIVSEVKSGYIWILADEGPSGDFEHALEHFIPEWYQRASADRFREADWSALSEHVEGSPFGQPTISTSIHQHQHRSTDRDIDRWYEAASKVLKGAVDLEKPRIYKGQESWPMADLFIVIPLVILDGNLLAAKCDPTGELSLEPREHAEVRFCYASSNYRKVDASIHVVTLDGLSKFLKRVKEAENVASVLSRKLYDQIHPKKSPSETSVDEKRPSPE